MNHDHRRKCIYSRNAVFYKKVQRFWKFGRKILLGIFLQYQYYRYNVTVRRVIFVSSISRQSGSSQSGSDCFRKIFSPRSGLFIKGSLNRTPLFSNKFDICLSAFILDNSKNPRIRIFYYYLKVGNKEKLEIYAMDQSRKLYRIYIKCV